MKPDLRRELERAAASGAGRERPPLRALWRTGRSRRHQHRALVVGVPAVLVAALVAGAMALGGGDTSQQVTAGPTGAATVTAVDSPPPAEHSYEQVKMAVSGPAGETVDGLPVVESGGSFDVHYDFADGWARTPSTDWERWTGTTWETTHRLGRGEPGLGSLPTVTPTGERRSERLVQVSDPGPDGFLAPRVPPGWYRVCTEVRGSEQIRPCVQLRVGAGPDSVGKPTGEQTPTPD